MKTHVIMFDVRIETEEDRVLSIKEIEDLEVFISNWLYPVATCKFSNNVTADYTQAGLINQHLVQIDDNKNK